MNVANFHLAGLDMVVIAAYFAAMVLIGLLASRKNVDASDYFLAGRSMAWPMIGLALFASNISSTTLVGLAGDAYSTGISVFNYEWMAAVVLVFFAVFMLPFVLRSQVYTMPEFLEKRYDGRSRTYFAALTLFLNIVVDTSASLYAGGLLIQQIIPGLPLWVTVAGMAACTGAYTVVGGFSAVMITETIQAVLLLSASLVITIFAFEEAGGVTQVLNSISPEKLSLIRPMDDAGVPWPGLVLGVPLLGFYFWCTNQFMVQRMLSAKSVDHARKGALFAGLLKLPVLFIMVLPGTAAILLYPELEQPDMVYPTLIFGLLPVGLIGLVIAGFLAALMSSVASTLNSASTLMTMDFIHRFKPGLSSKQLMIVGRIATLSFMLMAVAWAPMIHNFPSLFKYLQTILAYAVPPVVAMFLLGAFWSRVNAHGAFAALITGVVSGIALFIANEVMGVVHIHFLYVVPILMTISMVALIVGSLLTPPQDIETIRDFIWTPQAFAEESEELRAVPFYANYRVLSVVLLVVTVVLVGSFW